jgi:hypothetical protein
MEFGICNLSQVPGRAEPSDKSEMVTQLLYGEHFKVLNTRGSWCQVQCAHDNYTCWIDKKQFALIPEETFKKLADTPPSLTADLVQVVTDINGNSIPVLLGSSLPFLNGETLQIGNNTYSYDGMVQQVRREPSKQAITDNAFMYLHAPYLWGGRSPFGIDCSGLTQMAYKLEGVKLKRDANQQATQGIPLSFVEEAEPGDLAFFDNEEGAIIHVGIVLANNMIIHASGKVRVDKLDHQGIFNIDQKKYTHHLRLIKKVI